MTSLESLGSNSKCNREFMAFTIRWFVNFERFPGAGLYRTVPTIIFSTYVSTVIETIEI